MSAKI